MIICHTPNNYANNPYLQAYGLRKYGVKSYLLMPSYINPTTEKIWYGYKQMGNPYNIPIIYYHDTPSFLRQLASLGNEGLDIVHLYGGGKFWHAAYSKLLGAKIIRQFFGSDIRSIKKRREIAFNLFPEDGIVLSQVELANRLTWRGALNRMIQLAVAVDPVFYEIPKIGGSADEKIVFLPTRNDDFKKTSLAFDAWNRLRELDKDVKLYAVAWGDNYPRLKETYANDPRVVWMPLLNRKEYLEMMRRSWIVWGQFGGAGHGGTELEAMAARRPIFTNLNPASMKLYWNPPLIQAENPEELAQKTKQLLDNDEERKYITEKAFQWVQEVHGPFEIAAKLYKFYQRILEA